MRNKVELNMLIVVNNINLHNNIFNLNNLFIEVFYMSKNTYMDLFDNLLVFFFRGYL